MGIIRDVVELLPRSPWFHEARLLRIKLPASAPDPHINVVALEYKGELKAVPYVPLARADQSGTLILSAREAKIHGKQLVLESHTLALGVWYDSSEFPEWQIMVPRSGKYSVELELACLPSEQGGEFTVEVNGKPVTGKLKVPSFPASAMTGQNVAETLKKSITLTVASIKERFK